MITRVSFALAAICALGGCQALGLSPKPLGTDDYKALRTSADFGPAWANPTARPWILQALDLVNKLDAQRDAAAAIPAAP